MIAIKVSKKHTSNKKVKEENRIKQFNKLAVNSKYKKKIRKRRKQRNSRNKENAKNMINIKTQFRDTSFKEEYNDISFADESLEPLKPKIAAHEEYNESCVKWSTSKFPLQDQSGGDKSTSSSILKKRIKLLTKYRL